MRSSRTANKRLTKGALNKLTTDIARKRREVMRLQEEFGDMLDHLAVIGARAKSVGGKRYSTAQVKRAVGI